MTVSTDNGSSILLTWLRSLYNPVTTLAVVAVCCLVALGQGRLPSIIAPNPKEDQQLSSMEAEMHAKREIDASNKAHKENLNRARNLVSLSESLVRAFKQKNQLDREDIKKLEKAEKLVKSIREAAGGSASDVDIQELPSDLGSALCKLSELSDSLQKRVEKTPKQVVSTAIIDEANVLLELIRTVRLMQAKA